MEIPDYLTIITHPMDLQTVEEKLKKDDYSNDKEFESDVALIWRNAMTYNMEGTQVNEMAKSMEVEFEKFIKLPVEELTLKRHGPKN